MSKGLCDSKCEGRFQVLDSDVQFDHRFEGGMQWRGHWSIGGVVRVLR